MSDIVTYTGRVVNPLYLEPRNVNIIDIAHSLSNQCRFTGHTREFYSVAQHSVLVTEFLGYKVKADKQVQLTGLLHDASEAYLSDIARPVKHVEEMETYRDIEHGIQAVVCEAFGLDYPFPAVIHKADNALLAAEQRDLMPRHRHIESLMRYDLPITGWDPDFAKKRFLALYTELTGDIPKR